MSYISEFSDLIKQKMDEGMLPPVEVVSMLQEIMKVVYAAGEYRPGTRVADAVRKQAMYQIRNQLLSNHPELADEIAEIDALAPWGTDQGMQR